jgi:hypothetical protein
MVELQAARFGVTFVPNVVAPSDGQQSNLKAVSNI